MRIGITGSIACGKDMVSSMFAAEGFTIIDVDREYHELLAGDCDFRAKIFEAFGDRVRLGDGQLDRKTLGRIVYSDPAAMERLTSITHPVLVNRVESLLNDHQSKPVAVNASLLFEMGFGRLLDGVVAVTLDFETQVERLMVRDGIDRGYALRKIASQMSTGEKAALADWAIDNSGTPEETREQVRSLARVISDNAHGNIDGGRQ